MLSAVPNRAAATSSGESGVGESTVLPGPFSILNFVIRTGVTQVNLGRYGQPIPRWKRPAHSRSMSTPVTLIDATPRGKVCPPPLAAAAAAPDSPPSNSSAAAPTRRSRRLPTRVRCVSTFLDKNRRHIGKYQSKRKPKRTQRTPHLPAPRRRSTAPAAPECRRRGSRWRGSRSGSPAASTTRRRGGRLFLFCFVLFCFVVVFVPVSVSSPFLCAEHTRASHW
eukprot:COSAG01_NODE_6086_length_3861_cov_91.695906_4_plen_223_part_00